MNIHLVVISSLILFSSAKASILSPIESSECENREAQGYLSKSFDRQKQNIITPIKIAANGEILDISAERDDGSKKNNTSPGQQLANDQLIDISTERDGGSKKSNTSLGQQPANDQVYDIPTERNASSIKSKKSKAEQPIHGELIDIPTERDGRSQKKSVKPDDERESTESESRPVVIPVEGVH